MPALLLLAAAPALADERWLAVGDAPVAVPLSAAQRDRFGAGGMPSVGVYRSLAPWALVGARLRVGFLSDGPPPPSGMSDPGAGGFGSVSLAMRFRTSDGGRRGSGPWLELAGGPGLTGHDVRPAWEAGIGWGLAVGSVDVGPSFRMLRVESSASALDPGTATVGLFGLEVTFFDAGGARPRVVQAVRSITLPAQAPPPAEPDRDRDRIADREDPSPAEPEPEPEQPSADFTIENDRIVLEEQVLFDRNRARVKHGGKRVLAAIAAVWRQHSDWQRLVVEGHADVRGSDAVNDQLSELRSERVKEALGALGFAAGQVEAIGYGRRRPRDPGASEAAHQRNRRVEFVIIKELKP
jgi:peptidoglycan-associated lipoprotein